MRLKKYLKRQIKYILISFFIFSVFPFKTYGETEYSPDIRRIIERGEIIVAMHYKDAAPFFMHDEQGNFCGLDVELARDIAKSLGVKVKFKRDAKTFNAIIDMVFAKEADIAISNISKTLERGKRVLFTQTYLTLHQTLLINRLQAAQRKKGKDSVKFVNHRTSTIGVTAASSYIGFARMDFPRATIVPYDDFDFALVDVLEGKIMAAYCDDAYIQYWLKSHPDAILYLQKIVFDEKEDPMAIAVHWQDTHLHAWLNQYLHEICQDGTMDRLINKYLGPGNE
ncbi:MAG: amino acid ABC transporter substrate-binding protein [Candidatus Omnitrophica bacterium]|nr:amino acid ABC transporter substrate-binding protein [Candidatus Omnitrophota bacterium]